MKTKELLAEGFRELVLTMPFSKISIKLIADKAGVIRPTFYNYFQDKYEVVEYLFEKDVKSKIQVMLDNDMEPEAIKLLFICFEKNMAYYRKLFEIEGQNSFEEYFRAYIYNTFLNLLKKYPLKRFSPLITPDIMAHFNTVVLLEILKVWLNRAPHASTEDVYETYLIFLRTSVLNMIDYSPHTI